MADIYFYQGDTDEDDGGYCDANITATNQVSKAKLSISTLKWNKFTNNFQ